MRLKISARQSDLARLQAYSVGEALQIQYPGTEIEYRFKESLGDKNQSDPLWKLPEKGVFTEDFHRELLQGDTDMVVHSWKDLPTELKAQTEIVATLPRADQRDLLLVKRSHFTKLRREKKMSILSSSPRRSYNLTGLLKDVLPFALAEVSFESVRGNIPTRIRKLVEGAEADGLIVAKAALDRLLTAPQAEFTEVQKTLRTYLDQLNWMVLPLSANPNAAAQGALAIEILKSREDLKEVFAPLNDEKTYFCAQQERRVLASFGGGCHQKIGVSVLRRPYGDIQILRGLTDDGATLDQYEILKDSLQKFSASEMWSLGDQALFQREEIPLVGLPSQTNALYVSKFEAWPEALKFDHVIWTAGLKSWKKLAQKGLWVHGCSDGWGEEEEPHLQALAGKPLHWCKLTHAGGPPTSDKTHLATYRLKVCRPLEDLRGKKSFYWASGSQFLEALRQEKSILEGHHACGPGHTYQIIKETLQAAGQNLEAHLEIFLNQSEWRKKCTRKTAI